MYVEYSPWKYKISIALLYNSRRQIQKRRSKDGLTIKTTDN